MTSTNEIGLATERVRCSTEIDLSDLHCSTICENILWKPIACQQCETHFCAMCITKWLSKHPDQCPIRCENFIQRPCSKFIAKQLTKLQIICIYQSNGCNEIIPYDALEKHEMKCGYQNVKCSHCLLEMLQKDLNTHQSQCLSISTTCKDCKTVHQQNDAVTHHSDVFCLKEQLRQCRQESQHEIQQLREELRQIQNDQTTSLMSRGIISDDNAVTRIPIQSTVEIETLHRNRIVLNAKESQTVLTDELLCSVCHNAFWRPVSCRKCGTIFCRKCRPQIGFFKSITTFFGAERPRHGIYNCEHFEEATVPDRIITDLSRLRMRCAYAPNGCRMLLPYYDLERHEQQCEFENIPCQLCQLPLSQRPPIVKHTLRACFEEMRRKNPAGIQEQFMTLFNATERAEADYHRLQTITEKLQREIDGFDSKYIKKTDKDKN